MAKESPDERRLRRRLDAVHQNLKIYWQERERALDAVARLPDVERHIAELVLERDHLHVTLEKRFGASARTSTSRRDKIRRLREQIANLEREMRGD